MIESSSRISVPRPGRLIQYVKARIYSPTITPATARAVLDRYGLPSASPPSNLPLGWRNRNVLIDTSDGKKVLKLYRDKWQLSTIRYEHSILLRLQHLNFPAPRLVRTVDGDSLVIRNDGHYALFDFVAGTNYASTYLSRPLRRRLLTVAGRTLAGFHRQLAEFSPTGEHHLGFRSYTEDRWQDITWYVDRLKQLPNKADSSYENETLSDEDRDHLAWLAANGPQIREKLESLEGTLNEVELPRLIIHGDYGIHNLLYHNDGSATVHDLELARLEWRLTDLVITLSRLSQGDGRIFSDAYQAEFPLNPDEKHYYPQVWQTFMLQGAVRYWHTYYRLGGTYRLAAACTRARQADWALSNRERLPTP